MKSTAKLKTKAIDPQFLYAPRWPVTGTRLKILPFTDLTTPMDKREKRLPPMRSGLPAFTTSKPWKPV